ERTHASSDDSVIMAVPEPSAAAANSLRVMYELMQLVGSITDRKVLCERVMDMIFDHFEPDRGFILVRESDDAVLEPMVVRYRLQPRTKAEQKINVSRTIVQHVIKKHEGVLSS